MPQMPQPAPLGYLWGMGQEQAKARLSPTGLPTHPPLRGCRGRGAEGASLLEVWRGGVEVEI